MREKLLTFYPNVAEDFAKYQQRLVDAGAANLPTPEGAARHAKRFFDEQIAQQMPFVLQLGTEEGATGPLTDDQLERAQLRAVQQKNRDVLKQFEERLQNAPMTMRPEKRRFAEAFLKMAKGHSDLMDDRLSDADRVTEADLSEVAEQIAGDLHDLTRTLRQNREDT